MLIAESGATKTEWRLVGENKEILAFRTSGFNPNIMSAAAIREELAEILRKNLLGQDISEIYFYGAGLGQKSQRNIIETILFRLLPNSTIHVNHDLLAAARSTGFHEGIVGILGTGSNTCYYRYGEVVNRRGGHGYIFGDEGSGADLGKHLVKGLLEGRFPDSVRDFIESQEGVDVEELKVAIYRSETPNVRMARLSKYLDEILHHESIHQMILERFLAFLDTTVCRYENYSQMPISFVGSIAFFFKKILNEASQQREIRLLDIRHDPIDRLVDFHIKQEFQGSV